MSKIEPYEPRLSGWKVAAIQCLAFGVLQGALIGYLHSALPPRTAADLAYLLFVALVQGSLFGVGMAWFAARVRARTAIVLPPGEEVEHSSDANCGMSGGRLYLTNRHLIFKPHKFNLNTAAILVGRSEIAGAAAYRRLGLPNGLMVMLRNGDVWRFVVVDNEGWASRIRPVRA